MMPTSPRPPYHSVRRVFPSTAGRLACQTGPSHCIHRLSLLPECVGRQTVCLRPSRTSWSESVFPLCVGPTTRWCAALEWGCTPPQEPSPRSGLFCPGPSSLISPPPHSQAHHDFADDATYTRCLRCAGAPRRPASGSGISLHIPSWHAAPYVPREIRTVLLQYIDSDIGLRRDLSGSALPLILPSVSSRARVSGLTGSHSLRPVRSLAPLDGSDQDSPGHKGFYIQAFPESVTLLAAEHDYDSHWTVSVGGTFAHWNGNYPRCTRSVRALVSGRVRQWREPGFE